MKSGQGFAEALIIAGQATEARGPGETALHHPPAWQEHEAAFGLSVLNGFQLNAMLLGGDSGIFTRVSLIHKASSTCNTNAHSSLLTSRTQPVRRRFSMPPA